MALNWDITKIENAENLCWIENDDPNRTEDEKFKLNPVTESLIHLSMLTGIPKITKNNYKEIALRLVELEILGLAMVSTEGVEGRTEFETLRKYRNPSEEEVRLHIGMTTNVTPREPKKWNSYVRRLLREQAEKFLTTQDAVPSE